MENEQITQKLAGLLRCSERTAQSICSRLENVVSGTVTDIEVAQTSLGRILRFNDAAGNSYEAFLERGFFISMVFEGSVRGKQIYRAIQ